MADEPFFTTEEVLDYLQINLRTIYRLVKNKKIPAVRVGRQWRFRRRDLDAWLAANRSAAAAAAGRKRILVVDDDDAVRALLVSTLERGEYDVDAAPDGPAALERLDAGRYDLIVMDLKMPGMDGLSFLREARRRAYRMPAVIVTAYSTEASAIEAINLGGVSGYLTKPFRMARVLDIAARALGEPVTHAG